MGNTHIDLLNASKTREKAEISITPCDVEGVWKGVLNHRKGEETISDFELRVEKILSA